LKDIARTANKAKRENLNFIIRPLVVKDYWEKTTRSQGKYKALADYNRGATEGNDTAVHRGITHARSHQISDQNRR
jgi:hypothetical protein